MSSNEDWLNRIELKLDQETLSSSEFRGELRQSILSMGGFVKAVDKKLDDHINNLDAHGLGAKKELDTKVMGWMGVAATILTCFAGAIGAAVHKFFTHQ